MRIAICCFVLLLAGCSGELYTIYNTEEIKNLKNDEYTDEIIIKGIVAYPQINILEKYKTTILIDENRNILGREGDGCTPEYSYKFDTRVDYDNPYVIQYNSAWLETNKFGVQFENGSLTAVNTESAPFNPVGTLPDYLPYKFPTKDAEIAAKKGIDGEKLCNSGTALEGVYKHPGIK